MFEANIRKILEILENNKNINQNSSYFKLILELNKTVSNIECVRSAWSSMNLGFVFTARIGDDSS